MKFNDFLALDSKPRKTKDGYLVATAKVARTGIQLYRGAEVDRPDLDVVRVMRPEAEVFNKDSLASFVGKPMTNEHPAKPVSAESWKTEAIGSIGEGVLRDGDYISVPLVMMDASAIKDFENGKRELSMGYDAEIEFVDHADYDAIQKNIRINHIALVDKGRAGGARIGDKGGQGNSPTNPTGDHKMTHKVKFGDVTIEVSEQAAEAIASLSKQLEEAKAEAEKAEAKAQEAIDAKDKALAAKDAEIDKLKSETMTADKLDKAIADRVALITRAKSISDIDYNGLNSVEIKRKAIEAVRGAGSMKDKSEAYIDAAFDLLEPKKPAQKAQHADADYQSEYEKKLTQKWSK